MYLTISFLAALGRTWGLSRSPVCLIALVSGVVGVFGVEGAEVPLEPPVIVQYLRDADGGFGCLPCVAAPPRLCVLFGSIAQRSEERVWCYVPPWIVSFGPW